MLRHTLPLALLLCGSLPSAVSAQQKANFAHPDGTTHWYQAVAVPTGIDWDQANAAALAMGGYLATITSAAESQAIWPLVDVPALWHLDLAQGHWSGPWLGGVQLTTLSEPAGGWGWAQLETFAHSEWAQGQPDNGAGADRIHYGGEITGRASTWNDAPHGTKLRGFVVEFSGGTVPTTIGLRLDDPGSFEGYTLMAPLRSTYTYLLDPRGRLVHLWSSSYLAGLLGYLQPNGDLVRAGTVNNTNFQIGGAGGIVERFDWDGKLLWSWTHSSPTYVLHHDIEVLPNGNILMIAWEEKTVAEAIAAGRNPNLLPENRLIPDKIIEVQPSGTNGGTIVWEWHAWDHLIQDFDSTKANYGNVAAHPERIDVNYAINGGEADWMHSNALDYNAKLDQIVLSVRSFDEIWIIDHSTTTAEAKTGSGGRSGKGGRLLYRWGNPRAYRAGTLADQKLFKQHDSHWIEDGLPGAGNILLFNNGTARPGGDASSADELTPPTPDANGNYPMTGGVWGPAQLTWRYMDPNPTQWYSMFVSGAQRQPNGNTLICSGWTGGIFEVTAAKQKVWDYQNPSDAGTLGIQGVANQVQPWVFRSYRYAPDYGAFTGRNLQPLGPLEFYDGALLVEGSRLLHRAQIGTTVDFQLRAMRDAGKPYFLGTSMTPGSIAIDYRYMPVGYDELLVASMAGTLAPIFTNYFGILDPTTGLAEASFHVPQLPWLIGVEFQNVFLVYDPAARNAVGTISNATTLRIVP